ncbi:hypothetical protein C8F04DRAFT_496398 [Mycena alexandri]|uniref:Uncharacterized protein n=1 Tax=Mycena alexandri TaxID=1745969 RepID=A0AAD6RWP6_9AGAR|nr:hypothetical protein C8F04DRAFT_496398 [Mycena alexandri]
MVEEFSAYDYKFHKKPSDAAAASLCRHLISLRDLAISAPQERGMQFMLDLQIPPQNRHPAARQVPSTLTADPLPTRHSYPCSLIPHCSRVATGFPSVDGHSHRCPRNVPCHEDNSALPLSSPRSFQHPLARGLLQPSGSRAQRGLGVSKARASTRPVHPVFLLVFSISSLRLGRPRGSSSLNLFKALRSTTSQNPCRQTRCMILHSRFGRSERTWLSVAGPFAISVVPTSSSPAHPVQEWSS